MAVVFFLTLLAFGYEPGEAALAAVTSWGMYVLLDMTVGRRFSAWFARTRLGQRLYRFFSRLFGGKGGEE